MKDEQREPPSRSTFTEGVKAWLYFVPVLVGLVFILFRIFGPSQTFDSARWKGVALKNKRSSLTHVRNEMAEPLLKKLNDSYPPRAEVLELLGKPDSTKGSTLYYQLESRSLRVDFSPDDTFKAATVVGN